MGVDFLQGHGVGKPAELSAVLEGLGGDQDKARSA
jgi:hypothetical protein